jgi:methylated-DNA-[protein]-cysteine S-methyltransferase
MDADPGAARARARALDGLVARLRIAATARGVSRLALGGGGDSPGGPFVERAREELGQYLAGRRVFFTVPLDLEGFPAFQAAVLAEARRIPFGSVSSYATVARRIGRPQAARAVGNALAANPVPILVPCHRVIRGDGAWGHYALGGAVKTALLALERGTPPLVGRATTRVVCRRGCPASRGPENDAVDFAALGEALGNGYTPCPSCGPAAPDPSEA